MSHRTPTLRDHHTRRVQRVQRSRDGRAWICALDCGHVVTRVRRASREVPDTARCAQCAGTKGAA